MSNIKENDQIYKHLKISSAKGRSLSVLKLYWFLRNLNIPLFDYIDITYLGDRPTTFVFKNGGESGNTVTTIHIGYVNNLILYVLQDPDLSQSVNQNPLLIQVPAAAVAVAGVVPTMQVGGNVIQGLSPLLWYDFADESTVTVVNGRINAINSKGTNPLALTRPGSVPAQSVPNYETGINGLKCADFGVDFHNSALTNTSTASLSIAEVYIVLTCIGATFVTNPFATSPTGLLADLDTGASTLRWYARGRQNTSSMNVVSTGHMLNEVFVNGAVTASAVVLPTINNPGLLRLKNTNNAVSINTKGLQFGNEGDRNSKGWRGLVGEVIAFSSVLSDSDRLALQQFLKTKWNLPLP